MPRSSARASGVVHGRLRDGGDIGVEVVVGEDSAAPGLGLAEVSVMTEVAGGGERRVVDLLRIADAVAVAVCSPALPGGRDELQRTNGAVDRRPAIPESTVGVGDSGARLSGQVDPEDSGV